MTIMTMPTQDAYGSFDTRQVFANERKIRYCRSETLSEPFVYRPNKLVYPAKTKHHEKQDNAQNRSYPERFGNRIHIDLLELLKI